MLFSKRYIDALDMVHVTGTCDMLLNHSFTSTLHYYGPMSQMSTS